jgi:hypothetical protein
MNISFALFYIPSSIALTVENCSFIDVCADCSGDVIYGGVFNVEGSLSIENCYFHSCLNTHPTGLGGAMCMSSTCDSQTFRLARSHFENCSSSLGGAVYSNVNTGWTVNVENCIFINNLVKNVDSGSGGGLYLKFLSGSFSSLLIKDSFFSNFGSYDGVDIGVEGDYSLQFSNFDNSYSLSPGNLISFLSSNIVNYSSQVINFACAAVSYSGNEQRVLKECVEGCPEDECSSRVPDAEDSCVGVDEAVGLCRSYNGKCYLAENCPPFTEAISNTDDSMLICSKVIEKEFFIKENGEDGSNTCNSYDKGCKTLDYVISTYVNISGAVSVLYIDSGNYTFTTFTSSSPYKNISLTVSIYNSQSINLADFHTYPIIYPFSTDFTSLYVFYIYSNCSMLFEYIFFFLDDFSDAVVYLFYSFFFSFFYLFFISSF